MYLLTQCFCNYVCSSWLSWTAVRCIMSPKWCHQIRWVGGLLCPQEKFLSPPMFHCVIHYVLWCATCFYLHSLPEIVARCPIVTHINTFLLRSWCCWASSVPMFLLLCFVLTGIDFLSRLAVLENVKEIYSYQNGTCQAVGNSKEVYRYISM